MRVLVAKPSPGRFAFAAMPLNQSVEKWVEELSAYRDDVMRSRAG